MTYLWQERRQKACSKQTIWHDAGLTFPCDVGLVAAGKVAVAAEPVATLLPHPRQNLRLQQLLRRDYKNSFLSYFVGSTELYECMKHERNLCKQGGFFGMYRYFIQHCFICRPSESTVSEDAGIELRTVATRLHLNLEKCMYLRKKTKDKQTRQQDEFI